MKAKSADPGAGRRTTTPVRQTPDGRRLGRAFYARPTLDVARDLLGCRLVRRLPNGDRLRGVIVETEAYIGEDDRACHAWAGRTPRTEVMYGPPGRAYVYFIYGMYFMLNVVTEPHGFPAAVLIRAVRPEQGLETMARHRGLPREVAAGKAQDQARLTSGPGRLTQAFRIDKTHHGADLVRGELGIEQGEPSGRIASTVRIGVDYAGAWRRKRWRWIIAGDPYVSGPPALRRAPGS